MNRKNLLLSIILVLLLIGNSLLAYLLFFSRNLTIQNSNTTFSLSYHPTPSFTNLLNDWSVFNKSKQIVLQLTDKPQFHPNATTSAVLTNSSIVFNKKKAIIKVYVSRQARFLSEQSVSDTILQQFLLKLYMLTHPQYSLEGITRDYVPKLDQFLKNPQENPFKVTYR